MTAQKMKMMAITSRAAATISQEDHQHGEDHVLVGADGKDQFHQFSPTPVFITSNRRNPRKPGDDQQVGDPLGRSLGHGPEFARLISR